MKSTALIILMIVFSELNAQDPSLVIPVGHTTSVLSADISPDGQKYLNTSYDGTAKIWNNSGFELYAVHGFDRYANQASFNKTGEYFLVRYEKTVAVYRVETGELVSEFTKSSGIESARFTKNGDKIFLLLILRQGYLKRLPETRCTRLIWKSKKLWRLIFPGMNQPLLSFRKVLALLL
ncbi:MAG: hypothetical protein IPP39_11530 [Chitinophagaceae bacterium]|nr:hypothetical protein [Chitinophagaceae bacterium]